MFSLIVVLQTYQRIIEQWTDFGWKGPFKYHLVHSPCHWQGHLSLDQITQSPIQPDSEHLQGWGIHNQYVGFEE